MIRLSLFLLIFLSGTGQMPAYHNGRFDKKSTPATARYTSRCSFTPRIDHAMRVPFTKMHGLGNDFVLVRGDGLALPSADRIRSLADRRRGIGFDQLLWDRGTTSGRR
jgi:hypothetical protein